MKVRLYSPPKDGRKMIHLLTLLHQTPGDTHHLECTAICDPCDPYIELLCAVYMGQSVFQVLSSTLLQGLLLFIFLNDYVKNFSESNLNFYMYLF